MCSFKYWKKKKTFFSFYRHIKVRLTKKIHFSLYFLLCVIIFYCTLLCRFRLHSSSVLGFALSTIVSCLSTSCHIFWTFIDLLLIFSWCWFEIVFQNIWYRRACKMDLKIVHGKPKGHAIWVHKQVSAEGKIIIEFEWTKLSLIHIKGLLGR